MVKIEEALRKKEDQTVAQNNEIRFRYRFLTNKMSFSNIVLKLKKMFRNLE